MIILDVLDEARTELDDNHHGTAAGYAYDWQADDTDLLWKNIQMVRYLNWAITEIGIRNPILDDSSALTAITVVADTANYAYSPLIETVEAVTLTATGVDGRPLIKTTREAMDNHHRRGRYHTGIDWRSETGEAWYYLEDTRQRSLRLLDTPTAAGTLNLVVYRQYDETIAWADLENEDPASTEFNELADDYREALIFGICAQALRKRDADSYNVNAAERYEALFTNKVGSPVTHRDRETRRLMANLPVSMTPHPYTPRVRRSRNYYGRTTTEW